MKSPVATLCFSFVSFSHCKEGDEQCEGNLITFKILCVHGQKGAGHWRGPVSQPSPAT